ncbi:hypothetical protein Tco_0368870 [Tanacetum coccineum]
MDSIIPLGQKNTLAEYMILFGADNRPPMLDKDLYDSWKSRMELYMQNIEHGRMILESVENGLLIWPTIEENGATNIILQGLPTDIYSLVNHHGVSKDLWERVQLLMQGTSLTKQKRECKLYDAFDKFTHIKRESLHKYYLRFTQLINDMNIYNMKMEQFQINTKFLNNLPPEWSKFVTDVKLVKDLHTTNFDQLHAYLEQHELHANEVRLLRERNQNPLAFGRQGQSYSGTGYKSNATTSGGNNASGQTRVVKFYNYQGEGHMARQCTQPKRPRNATWYKDKAMLVEAQEAGKILDEEQLAFLADLGVPDGQAAQQDLMILSVIEQMSEQMINHVNNWEKANKEQNNDSVPAELERYNERVKTFEQRLNIDLSSHEKMIDSQMDDMIKEKLALKEQVNSLEQNLSKQIKENECLLQTFTVFKNESKEKENKYMENEIDLEKKIKELDNIIFKVGQSAQTVHMLTKPQHVAMHVIDDEETLILEEESRSKMSEKENDPEAIKQNISNKPIDYEKLNRLSEYFGKHFTPQQELSAEQAFWLRMSNPTSKSSDASPVKIEALKELPKVSLVNESLKKLKFHLARFDNVVKIRTTPDAHTEGEWGFEHTKAIFNNEIILFLKSLKDIFNVFDKDLLNEIMEVKTVFDQMDIIVQQSLVDKQCLEIAKKESLLENDRLLQQIMSQDVLLTVMNSMSLIGESVNMERKRNESCDKCFNLDVELLKSQNVHNDLLKSYSQLEKHCISLELSIQLNQEIFQKDDSCNNQNALEIPEFFKHNDLKA